MASDDEASRRDDEEKFDESQRGRRWRGAGMPGQRLALERVDEKSSHQVPDKGQLRYK